MAFRFALAALLKYRESLEQREYLALEKVQQEIVQVENLIRQCEQQLSAAQARRDRDLKSGVISIQLQAIYQEETALEELQEKLRAHWQQLQVFFFKQKTAYEIAHRNREVLDNLRLKQLDAYRKEQAKREQKTLDDIFLARRRRSQ